MVENRLNNPRAISGDTIRTILAAGDTPTIQFSEPVYTPALLRDVNALCREFGDKLEVRFYGHYDGPFDAAVLAHLPDVAWLSVDTLTQIANEQVIGKLPRLSRLSFGVFRFDAPDILATIDVTRLTELRLGENAKRNFDLAPLAGAAGLTSLVLAGHARNIAALSGLPALRDLTLAGIANKQSLEFLRDVRALSSLSLLLGGRRSIAEIVHPGLEQLSVTWVKGLEDVGPLARFPRLRSLTIDRQAKVTAIDLAGPALRKVVLMDCKALAQIAGLDGLDQLVKFRVARTKLDLDALLARQWPASLGVLGLYGASQKWNTAARAELDRRGYREYAG